MSLDESEAVPPERAAADGVLPGGVHLVLEPRVGRPARGVLRRAGHERRHIHCGHLILILGLIPILEIEIESISIRKRSKCTRDCEL